MPFYLEYRHIDGNHKLIDPWGFVIHGGIDGFSRLCVYLHCSTSNRADVVLRGFQTAVENHGCPSRVRCDYGTENVDVGRYMLQRQGTNRGSVITGLSTHNQRIERLWRDVSQSVNCIFAEIFHFMEDQGIADRYNPLHVYAMRFIFTPRINKSLEEFTRQWNNHPIRTAQHKSPRQLWVHGMLQNPGRREVDSIVHDIDEEGPLPAIRTNNNVVVPQVTLDLTENDIQDLVNAVNPLAEDDNQGIGLFSEAVCFLEQRLGLR